MSLRVCITTDEFWPQTGGVGVSVDRVSKILAGIGYEVHIVFFNDDSSSVNESDDEFPFNLLARTDSRALGDGRMLHVIVPGREFGPSDKTKSLQEFQLQLQNLHDIYHFDIFHAFYISATGFATGLVAKRCKAKFIASVRGNDMHWHVFNHRSNHILWTLMNADAISCVSVDLLEFTAALLGTHDKLLFIPNSIDPGQFEPIIHDRLERATWFNKAKFAGLLADGITDRTEAIKPVIGTSGYFKRKKGIEYLLKAGIDLAKERDISFLLVGQAVASEAKYWDSVFTKIAGQLDLHITGHVPHEQVMTSLMAMDIYVASSLYEGFPNSLLEAMLLGLPIVSTKVGAMRDMLVDGIDALLVPPGSSEAIAQALKRLLNDPDLCYKLGENGKKKVLRDFSIENEASGWRHCYSLCTC